jgi:hypothetical protein
MFVTFTYSNNCVCVNTKCVKMDKSTDAPTSSSTNASNTDGPTCVIVLGMAGSGKTTFVQVCSNVIGIIQSFCVLCEFDLIKLSGLICDQQILAINVPYIFYYTLHSLI